MLGEEKLGLGGGIVTKLPNPLATLQYFTYGEKDGRYNVTVNPASIGAVLNKGGYRELEGEIDSMADVLSRDFLAQVEIVQPNAPQTKTDATIYRDAACIKYNLLFQALAWALTQRDQGGVDFLLQKIGEIPHKKPYYLEEISEKNPILAAFDAAIATNNAAALEKIIEMRGLKAVYHEGREMPLLNYLILKSQDEGLIKKLIVNATAAELNWKDKDGNSALDFAVLTRKPNLIQALIANGINYTDFKAPKNGQNYEDEIAEIEKSKANPLQQLASFINNSLPVSARIVIREGDAVSFSCQTSEASFFVRMYEGEISIKKTGESAEQNEVQTIALSEFVDGYTVGKYLESNGIEAQGIKFLKRNGKEVVQNEGDNSKTKKPFLKRVVGGDAAMKPKKEAFEESRHAARENVSGLEKPSRDFSPAREEVSTPEVAAIKAPANVIPSESPKPQSMKQVQGNKERMDAIMKKAGEEFNARTKVEWKRQTKGNSSSQI